MAKRKLPVPSKMDSGKLLLNTLKELIKKQKMPYRTIAAGLGLSESGFKKILSSDDCSFNRLDQICRILGLQLSDLIHQQSQQIVYNVEFTPVQELHFEKDAKLFLLYWFLVYERRGVDECRQILGLSEKESFQKIRKLDQFKLLQLLPQNKLRLPPPTAIRWIGKTKFVHSLYLKWGQKMLKDHLSSNESQKLFLIRYIQMTSETYEQFKVDLKNLEMEYVYRGIREMKTFSTGLQHVRWLMMCDQESFAMNQLQSLD